MIYRLDTGIETTEHVFRGNEFDASRFETYVKENGLRAFLIFNDLNDSGKRMEEYMKSYMADYAPVQMIQDEGAALYILY